MTDLTLVIGDQNKSSWSLRPWLLMRHAGVDFRTEKVLLDRPDSRAALEAASPSGLVPCLKTGDLCVWDSLAIAEFIAEKFPEKRLWPSDEAARAHARSSAAEMHSGFSALRTIWPMEFVAEGRGHLTPTDVERDLQRIGSLWTEARQNYGAGGAFLYGAFSVADAMYAPVVSRIKTYGPVALSAPAQAWTDMMWALPAMREWGAGAREEVAQ